MSEGLKQPESTEVGWATREKLLALAKDKPPRDPEVKTLLLEWMVETAILEESGASSIDYLDVSIMHAVMKYRLGFLEKDEVIEELEQISVSSETQSDDPNTLDKAELKRRLNDLLLAIEDDTFQ